MMRYLLAILLLCAVGCEPKPSASQNGSAESAVPETATEPGDGGSTAGADAQDQLTETAEEDLAVANADADEAEVASPETTSDQAADAKPVVVAFEDIELLMQEDTVFRPIMLTDAVRELEGKRIRINGYMLPDTKTKGIKEFILLKNTECKFGVGGRADHLINVILAGELRTNFYDTPITVEGVLSVKPFSGPDGNTWSIYDLDGQSVERFKRN